MLPLNYAELLRFICLLEATLIWGLIIKPCKIKNDAPFLYFCKVKMMVMKTKITKTKETSWALPGKPISMDEFRAGIKEAEKGPFYTIEESKKILAEWRKKRNSQ